MADNYLDKQFQDYEARQAKKEKARKERLRRYREAYIKRLKSSSIPPEEGETKSETP
ncbi:MAG: hypothetical protein IKX39_00695 [Muribaculaceae bacterium]|nr:hypothetical protein [Muribaculaceae bacterium]